MLTKLCLLLSKNQKFQTILKFSKLDPKGIRIFSLVIPIFGILVFLMDLMFALALQRFLSSVGLISGVTNTRFFGDVKSVNAEAVSLFIITFFRLLLISLNSILMGLGFARMEKILRNVIQRKAFMRFLDDVSKTSYQFNEIATGASNFFSSALSLISRFIIATSLLFGLTWYSWKLTILLILISLLTFPIQMRITRRIGKASRTILHAIEGTSRQLLTSIMNFLFINIHRLREENEVIISHGLENIYSARKRFFILTSIRTTIPQLTGVIAFILIAASPLSNQLDNKSEIIPFLYLLLRFFQSLGDISRTTSHLRLDFPRLEHLLKYLENSESEILPLSQHNSVRTKVIPGYTLSSLEFEWGKSGKRIKYPNFEIQPGSIVHIQGKSGTGKTTLLLLIVGLIRPKFGTIETIPSRHESHKSKFNNPKSISWEVCTAYIGSEPFFINGSIRSNLNYGQKLPISDQQMLESLHRVKLISNIGEVEYLEKIISESGVGLSAGQKQRLSWVRALLMNPTLLILDEATSNLDKSTKEIFNNIIAEGRGLRTTLIVDHNSDLSSLSDFTIKL
jgi:ABC-type multidrug transport system fused ATPase/permease subunit